MIQVTIDTQQDYTQFIVSGEVSIDDLIDAVKTYYSSDPTRLLLWSFPDVQRGGFTPADIDRLISLVALYSEKRPGGKTALVASGDYAYGLSRMHAAKAEVRKIPVEYFVSRQIEKALDWLGVKHTSLLADK